MAWLEQQLFGSKSEKIDPNQLSLLDDEAGKQDPLPVEEPSEQEEVKSSERRKRRTKAEIYNLEKLLKVVVAELIPEEVQANPDAYEKFGEDYHDELDYVAGSVRVARTIIPKFKLKEDQKSAPQQCPAPESDVPGTMLTAAMATQFVLDKHCDHLTHFRIAQRLKREFGIDVNDSTINNWVHLTADYLKPIAEAIGEELRASPVLQLDETPIKYLAKGVQQAMNGFMWVMRDPENKACYYHWEQRRNLEALKNTLGYDATTNTLSFQGIIQCDGYKVYDALRAGLSGIELAGCLAHIRRKFVDDPDLKHLPWVREVLRLIQKLYQIERELKKANAPPGKVKEVRQKHAKPIIKELHTLLKTQEKAMLRRQSSESKAVAYALRQWPCFIRYLEDGRIEIDNNGVERAIRPTKLNLKNCLFFGSLEAGENNAVLYTLIENCKAIGLNPRVYLEAAIKGRKKNCPPVELTPHSMQNHLFDELKAIV